MTQMDLAFEMQVDVGTISRWETGGSSPSKSHMMLWSIKTGVPQADAMSRLIDHRMKRRAINSIQNIPGSPAIAHQKIAAKSKRKKR